MNKATSRASRRRKTVFWLIALTVVLALLLIGGLRLLSGYVVLVPGLSGGGTANVSAPPANAPRTKAR
ncbi:MAG: hypothetical protein C4321_06615 [Chloroflexota bacterium]